MGTMTAMTDKYMSDPTLTPEEEAALDRKITALRDEGLRTTGGRGVNDVARAGWKAGYAARQVRERAEFASAYGKRAENVIKALLAIVEPNNSQKIAVMRAAVDFVGELEKRP